MITLVSFVAYTSILLQDEASTVTLVPYGAKVR